MVSLVLTWKVSKTPSSSNKFYLLIRNPKSQQTWPLLFWSTRNISYKDIHLSYFVALLLTVDALIFEYWSTTVPDLNTSSTEFIEESSFTENQVCYVLGIITFLVVHGNPVHQMTLSSMLLLGWNKRNY
ncbi:hypothetical protein BDB01DRAFT_838433 [Pilobolus umbonatus]|nr:hypothetical protein BDB01DRAFT_838433 [Pilobolus umbonatus]